jgi:hypothetical protein
LVPEPPEDAFMPNRFRNVRGALAALVVALAALAGWAAPPKPAPAGNKLYTVVYDVADLLRKPGHTGYARIEDVIKLIVTSVDPEAWNKAGDSTLEEVNGTKLHVTTDAGRHKEIEELLAAARRRMDVRVDVKSELFEVERKVYEKEFKEKLKDGQAVVGEKLVEELRTRGARVKDAAVSAADGETMTLLSLRRAFTYVEKPADGNKPAIRGSGLTGLRVTAPVSVTPDRRFVRFKVTRRLTELAGLKKRTVTDPDTGNEGEVEVPDLTESSATFGIEVGDGEPVLLIIPAVDGKAGDRVRLLLVRPTIYIEEEEKERKKGAP